MRLPGSIDTEKAFDEKTGELNTLMLQDKPLEGLTTMHTAFLMAVVQAISLEQIDDGSNTVSFYLPAICRELGIDPRQYSSKRGDTTDFSELRFNALIDIIRPFDPLVGRTPDGSYYRVLTFESYDKDSETMAVSTPYLYRLKEIAAQRATDSKHPQLNRLLHGAVVNEPNRAAVELASRILTGIVKRGVRADYKTYRAEPKVSKKTVTTIDGTGKRTTTITTYKGESQEADQPPKEKQVTWKAKFSTLIGDCPQATLQLHAAKTVQAYNSKLKQLFEAAYRIIAEKSDAPARYIDFTLPTTQRTVKGKKQQCYDVPTKSTINRYMVITHKGINPDFQP